MSLHTFSIDGSNSAAIEELKKQVANIVQELNLLKEKQALQTGMCFIRLYR